MRSLEVVELYKIIRPYIKKFIAVTFLMVISAGIFLTLPLVSKEMMDKGFIPRDSAVVFKTSLFIFGLVLLQQLLEYLKELVRSKIKAQIMIDLYRRIFDHICKVKLQFLPNNVSKLYNQIQTDITIISSIADNNIFFVISQSFNVIGGIIGLFLINRKLALIVMCFIPLKYILILYFAKQRKRLSEDLIQGNSKFAQWFENTVAGIKELKMFQLESTKAMELDKIQMQNINIDRNIVLYTSYNIISDRILTESLACIIYIIGIYFIMDETITVGSIFAIITYIIFVTAPISAILNIKYMLAGIIPSTKRHLEFLNKTKESIIGESIDNLAMYKPPLLTFSNVCFKYENTDQYILKNITLSIMQGEKIAFCGKNGSGKSTLFNLLLRFYEPIEGSIFLYGKDISLYNIEEYRSMFSIVDQDIYLFEGDIKYNIILNGVYNEKYLSKITQIANLFDVFKEKDYSYDLGTNGEKLSGGQRQKIALARALYQNHEIFIFDEATSNLDIQGKQFFSSLLNTYLKQKTVLIITHDGDLLSSMDTVVYFDKGNIRIVRTEDLSL